MVLRRTVAGAVLVVTGLALWAAQVSHAGSRAPATVQKQIAAEVQLMFSVWFGPPPRSPNEQVTNVVYPICVSTVDSRFAFAVVTPVQPDGVATQPGFIYLRRVHKGYRVLGQLLSATTADDRPLGVSKQVHREFEPGGGYGTCTYQGGAAVLRAKREHQAPFFTH